MTTGNDQTTETVKEIKKKFRLFMNGQASGSMREKGVDYKINWGIPLVSLRQLAAPYGKDEKLATALWSSSTRECRLMATMIMPPEAMTQQAARKWMEGIDSQELAEVCAFNLFSKMTSAKQLAFGWIESDNRLSQIAAYHILSRLFRQGDILNDEAKEAYLKHASKSYTQADVALQHAISNSLVLFAESSEKNRSMAEIACKAYDLDIL